MSVLKNSLIKASAGTGKTFALATRMIRLMLLGVEPNQIVALTFSRAAAGEIYNQLAGRLAEAATSDVQATEESIRVYEGLEPETAQHLRKIHGADLTRTLFIALLRKLISMQHLSMIGTIDSFMTRMVQAFPLELGLQGSLTIMDEYRKAREEHAAIAALLNQGMTASGAQAFFESFRQATFGKEGKTYDEKLTRFVKAWHSTLQDYPDRRAWGQPETIWPNGVIPFATHDSPEHLADRLASEIRDAWAGLDRATYWDDFCVYVRTFNNTLPSTLPSAIKNVFSAYKPGATSIEITYNRKAICFTGAQAQLIMQTVENLYGRVLRARCEMTQGVYRLMSQVEAAYAARTRSSGLLTFDDIPRLISNLDEAVRRNIEYRFDGRFKHWVLDEFQDTSHAQWTAIRNLVDEVIQSTEDERSIFIVGDSKQAIYGWRGGDVAIFENEIGSGHYALSDLSRSYRYCPQIARLINAVFDGTRLAGTLGSVFAPAGEKWKKLWVPHTSACPDGFVSVERIQAPAKDTDEKTADPYVKAASAHLRRVRPWERGLTSAILVRSNAHGQLFAEALRSEGIPVVWEGESAICDTPVVTAILHLLHAAEHPSDTLAWRHVCASPLAQTAFKEACAAPGPIGPALLSRSVLEDVARQGLDRTLRIMIEALAETGIDAFTRSRLDDLLRAATRFMAEADAETMLTDFTAYVEASNRRDIADASTVKILTIHRSKGLGFDFVILPIMETTGLSTVRSGETLFAADDAWLLADPGKQVSENDATLKAARCRFENDGLFEALCVQYVAMTRAKRALTVLLKPAAKSATDTLYFSDCVERALATALPWSDGDPEWFEHLPPPDFSRPPAPAVPRLTVREKRQTVRRATPSASAFHGCAASDLFVRQENRATQRGTRLHEALSRIVWLNETAPQPADLPVSEVDLTVDSAFRDALRQPPHAIDLWRERSFELIADGLWISGTLDRVVFFETNGVRSAQIYDFKTNRKRDNEADDDFAKRMQETYAGQMTHYRQALAHLAGLPPYAICCTLLLTETLQAITS